MTTAEASPIQTLYCLCGEFCVVLEKSLDALPRRPSDNAFVLRNKVANGKPKTTYRWNARPDKKPVLIKRDTGIERIFRFRCTRCDLPIGYETSDPAYVEMKGEKYRDTYTYLLDGALTPVQNTLPENAFGPSEGPAEDVQAAAA